MDNFFHCGKQNRSSGYMLVHLEDASGIAGTSSGITASRSALAVPGPHICFNFRQGFGESEMKAVPR